MSPKPLVADITAEDFEVPDCITDLIQLIEDSISAYNVLNFTQKERIRWRAKLNELIDECNERRGFKVYNHFR